MQFCVWSACLNIYIKVTTPRSTDCHCTPFYLDENLLLQSNHGIVLFMTILWWVVHFLYQLDTSNCIMILSKPHYLIALSFVNLMYFNNAIPGAHCLIRLDDGAVYICDILLFV